MHNDKLGLGVALLHEQRFITALKQVPVFAPKPIESIRERRFEPLHPRDQIALRRLDQQMKVVSHHGESV